MVEKCRCRRRSVLAEPEAPCCSGTSQTLRCASRYHGAIRVSKAAMAAHQRFRAQPARKEEVVPAHSSKVGENVEDDRPLPPVAGLLFRFTGAGSSLSIHQASKPLAILSCPCLRCHITQKQVLVGQRNHLGSGGLCNFLHGFAEQVLRR